MIKVSLLLVVFFVSFSFITDFDCKSVTDWLQAGGSIIAAITAITALFFAKQAYTFEKKKERLSFMPIFEFNYELGHKFCNDSRTKKVEEDYYKFQLLHIGSNAYNLELIQTDDKIRILRNRDQEVITSNTLFLFVYGSHEAIREYKFYLKFNDILGNEYQQLFTKKGLYVYPSIPKLKRLAN